LAVQNKDGLWNVPYLPIDPADLGRNYDSVIRVDSQSGKGGVAYLMEVEFSGEVQTYTDSHGGEKSAQDIWNLFDAAYLQAPGGGHALCGTPPL
jgi:2-isopropylmalate synthase